jgi:hypothetical protein
VSEPQVGVSVCYRGLPASSTGGAAGSGAEAAATLSSTRATTPGRSRGGSAIGRSRARPCTPRWRRTGSRTSGGTKSAVPTTGMRRRGRWPITSDRHNLGLLSRPDGAMVGRGILWWMGPGITAKLMSVRVKRRIRLILGAAYPWKGRADFGVKSPSRRPNGTKCLNGWSRLNRPHRVKSPCGLGCAKPRRHSPSRD